MTNMERIEAIKVLGNLLGVTSIDSKSRKVIEEKIMGFVSAING